MQSSVLAVSWLCLCVFVSDYVKKTHCAWKTISSAGADDTHFLFLFSMFLASEDKECGLLKSAKQQLKQGFCHT